jgi:hypothetical protein
LVRSNIAIVAVSVETTYANIQAAPRHRRSPAHWSESIADGSLAFIDQVRSTLGFKVAHRDVVEPDGSYALRATEEYALKFAAETEALGSQNTFFGKKSFNEATT